MPVGVVKTFNNDTGYGFIETDEGELVFVHHSSIVMEGFRTLSPGARVLFDIMIGKRGPEAKEVRKI